VREHQPCGSGTNNAHLCSDCGHFGALAVYLIFRDST
jgi:hypothetical protein